MKKRKITYILSGIDKAQAFEWISLGIDSSRFEISFIIINKKEPFLYKWLKGRRIRVNYINGGGKLSYLTSFFKIFFILLKNRPDVVHTHLLQANLTGLSAAKILFIKKRYYTRHHSTFHHEYYPKAVRLDKICNQLASGIVAISENVKNVLIEKENVDPEKIVLIHHGFDLGEFLKVSNTRVEALKKKYNISDTFHPVIGVISRQTEWKGIQYTIEAFRTVVNRYPNALLILANSSGSYHHHIRILLRENIPERNFIEIEFENDLFALYKLFDIYVHVPVNGEIEAFGQTYVEALASSVPSVFTLSGVATEFIIDRENALVVPFRDSRSIAEKILELIPDASLRNSLTEQGLKDIGIFNLNLFIQKLEHIYA